MVTPFMRDMSPLSKWSTPPRILRGADLPLPCHRQANLVGGGDLVFKEELVAETLTAALVCMRLFVALSARCRTSPARWPDLEGTCQLLESTKTDQL